ncbi:hypothetical protein DGG96_11360 [Legionella qingyii]|uniref:MFS transporter n=1 Tax=Legionella qingyii TaxID=2184757 RepID=A0A317TZQ8_9GAMM|nr:hypothetical protein [Legionella qingyii]PWY54579.1 hypothetical protein DGG96_16370 [Legionella qingyii]PWY55521.1 hypothetical protein DGG96_11360 [Legionella qingyii]RUR21471.1 hypothetical protein ELY20_12265 [Legionella qingyii]
MKQISDIKWLALSAGVSSLGCAMSIIFIPLMIYNKTHNPLIMALQVFVQLLGNFVACQVIGRFKIGNNDKSSLVICNFLLAITILILAWVSDSLLVPSFFMVTMLSSILNTCSRGYYESLIGTISHESANSRQNLIGITKSYENFGTILGSSLTVPLLAWGSSSTVFIIDSVTYLFAAMLVSNLRCVGQAFTRMSTQPITLFILFKQKSRNLTISHGFLAMSLFLLNGSVIYVLKESFNVSDRLISFYYVSQFTFSFLGAFIVSLITKKRIINSSQAQWLRLSYAIPFLIIATHNSVYLFVIMISFLAFVHTFSLPVWQSFFQDCAEEASDWRLIGAARKTYVSIIGGLGSLLAGLLLTITDYQKIYLLASACCICSALCFIKSSIRMEPSKS